MTKSARQWVLFRIKYSSLLIDYYQQTCLIFAGDFNAKFSIRCSSDINNKGVIEIPNIGITTGWQMNKPAHFVNRTFYCNNSMIFFNKIYAIA